MFAWLRNINAPHFVSTALINVWFSLPLLDVVLIEPVLRDENIELVEMWLFAELDQGREIDVAVDDVLHARLRLAHVVNAAADHEWLLDAVCGLNCHGVADVCLAQPETHRAQSVSRLSQAATRRSPARAC